MLTKADNAILVHTGPGTPMGELFRRFWTPVALASELGGPDSAPIHVNVLGEALVAFRDSSGNIGLLDAYCPHRRANLYWGRNEQRGLRCVYHGWKFDATGQCVDLPNCPEGANLKNKVRTNAYPVIERAGILWSYLGPTEVMPEFPQIDALDVPESHRYITKMVAHGNYAQLQEGDIDSSHVPFLHSRLDGGGVAGGRILPSTFDDTQPRWFITHTPYGLQLAAQRNAGPKKFQWRVNQFLMPYLVQIATPAGVPILTQIRTPIDDYRSLHFRFWSMPERPLNDVEMAMIHDAVTVPEMIPGTFLMKENLENEYLLDRDAQRSASFTGIKSFVAQDLAVTQDQGGYGTIADRSREYLTSSDKAIIAWRKRNITAAKELARGVEPSEPRTPAAYNVRPGDFVLGRDIALEDRGGQLLGSAL